MLAAYSAAVGVGCANTEPGPCECVGTIPGGELRTACGTTQCIAGVPYGCSDAGAISREPGTCGPPPTNPRPSDTPDVLIVAVSGHCFPACSYNSEYLMSEGTVQVLAAPFLDRGLRVDAVSTTDNFYDVPRDSAAPVAFGFLTLLSSLYDARETLVADWDNPTRIVVVAHSHGAVWAHLALHVMEQRGEPLPVDVLIDLDGISISWEDDLGTVFVGDGWSAVIEAYTARTGTVWPFPVAHPTDQFEIPGLAELQDIEDIIPDSVAINLEVWSNDHLGVRDSQHNHRLDGTERDVLFGQSGVNHETTDNPTSDAVVWAAAELRAAYGL